MTVIKLILIIGAGLSFNLALAHAKNKWSELSLEQKANLLLELEYIEEANLPKDIKIINYAAKGDLDTKSLNITNKVHHVYVQSLLEAFEDKVSRESIEQSEYSEYGESVITSLYLIIDNSGVVIASVLEMFQDGRDQDGNESDVNWRALVRFDQNGDVLLDESGQPFDELYFEWSGH